jgi:hypothetical protein
MLLSQENRSPLDGSLNVSKDGSIRMESPALMDSIPVKSLANADWVLLECSTEAELRYAYRTLRELTDDPAAGREIDAAFHRHLERIQAKVAMVAVRS